MAAFADGRYGSRFAVGCPLLDTPRADPDEPNSSIRLLPWVFDGEALSLPYAAQRLCHALPALGPVRALLVRISLGPCPWLHRLRNRQPSFVRRLHSYYGRV